MAESDRHAPGSTPPPPTSPPEVPELQEAPRTLGRFLSQLGPGLILAGAVVGSGELIGTTKTGAQAGFWLLWLIVIGCVIKVFAQIEFGRYAICTGRATMAAMNEVPGPRWCVSWLLWYWLVMFVISIAQLGGVVGGVAQSLAMSVPITGDFNRLIEEQDAWAAAGPQSAASDTDRPGADMRGPRPDRLTQDDAYWAGLITAATILLLVNGRYRLVQNASTVMVALFTAVSVFCVIALQAQPDWAIHAGDLAQGLSFRLPPSHGSGTWTPLATALASFGIIGVGANELIAYPYWCLEKGYARFTGPCDPTDSWARRARGWMRVMHWDAYMSMAVYTFATVAFYLLGAAVLHRQGLDPEGSQMIRTLSRMYLPVFGPWAEWFFLLGAFAVLYSTFFVASASHARVAADAVRVFGVGAGNEKARLWWVRMFCIGFPTFAFLAFACIRAPVGLILVSGVMQAIMLPMLGGATLYFRYRRCDPRIAPGPLWDVLLWLSAAGLFVAGAWVAVAQLLRLLPHGS